MTFFTLHFNLINFIKSDSRFKWYIFHCDTLNRRLLKWSCNSAKLKLILYFPFMHDSFMGGVAVFHFWTENDEKLKNCWAKVNVWKVWKFNFFSLIFFTILMRIKSRKYLILFERKEFYHSALLFFIVYFSFLLFSSDFRRRSSSRMMKNGRRVRQ